MPPRDRQLSAVPEPDEYRHLVVVDTRTGEQLVGEHPLVVKLRQANEALQKEKQGWITRYYNAIEDKQASALGHELYPVAERLFKIWQAVGNHKTSKWTADRFWQIEGFLKDGSTGPVAADGPPTNDFERCAAAIVGRCLDCFVKARPNGSVKKYDEWGRIFKNSDEFDESMKRRPRDWRKRLAAADPGELRSGPRSLEGGDDGRDQAGPAE